MMDSQETPIVKEGIVNETTNVANTEETKVIAEDAQPVAEETVEVETAETPVETTAEEAPQEEEKTPQIPLMTTKAEVLARAPEIAESDQTGERQELDLLKQLFYKYQRAENQEARQAYLDAGGDPEAYEPKPSADEEAFKSAMQTIRQRRADQQAAIERERQANLEKKLEIIEKIKVLAATPEEANKTYDEFKQLQAEWREIGSVPPEKATEVWKNHQHFVEQFYDLLKLNSEMREYDFKKNLEAKTRLCEQAEKLAEEADVISAFNQLQGLHQEYKEIGPVAKELREEIWNRFKAASTIVNKRHQEHFEAQKAREEENLQKKTELCEKVEAIETEGLKTYADWEAKTQEIIDVQAVWKTIGYAPQKMNAKIFERFRAACDKFFEQKVSFFKTLREGLNENYVAKKALVEKAEALKDSTEWKETGDALIQLQKQWKTIGAVPKKYSDQLWKRFIDACDYFFEQKGKATASERNEQQENLAKKLDIIEQLKALGENAAEVTIEKVRELQQNWAEVGHVPFRDKDKVYKQYREICDKLYEGLSKSRAARRLNSFKNSLKATAEQAGNGLVGERNRLTRAYENLKSEIQTYENNLGFLSSKSKKGNSLVEELGKKVEKLKGELSLLAEKINAVNEQIKADKAEKEGKE